MQLSFISYDQWTVHVLCRKVSIDKGMINHGLKREKKKKKKKEKKKLSFRVLLSN